MTIIVMLNFLNNKSGKEKVIPSTSRKEEIKGEYYENMDEVRQSEKEINSALRSAFGQVEEEYKTGKASYERVY